MRTGSSNIKTKNAKKKGFLFRAFDLNKNRMECKLSSFFSFVVGFVACWWWRLKYLSPENKLIRKTIFHTILSSIHLHKYGKLCSVSNRNEIMKYKMRKRKQFEKYVCATLWTSFKFRHTNKKKKKIRIPQVRTAVSTHLM